MTPEIYNKFDDFLTRFNSSDNKPSLQSEFEDLFLEILSLLDDPRDIEYLGESSYSGVNFLIAPDNVYMRTNLKIEIELTKTGLTAYSAFHNGFWVAPFMIASSGCCSRYKEIRKAFVDKFRKLMLLED